MSALKVAVSIIYMLICIGLIVTVLLQPGKSAGLSGVIGGGAELFFGKKKGIEEKLAKFTEILAALFLILSIVMMILFTK